MSPALTSFGSSATAQENPLKFAVKDWTAQVIWDANAEAAQKLKDAINTFYLCTTGQSPTYTTLLIRSK